MTTRPCAAMLDWLEKRHAAIMDCEKRPHACMDAGDIDAYRSKCGERAPKSLRNCQDAENSLRPCRQKLGNSCADRLAAFAGGA